MSDLGFGSDGAQRINFESGLYDIGPYLKLTCIQKSGGHFSGIVTVGAWRFDMLWNLNIGLIVFIANYLYPLSIPVLIY